jgi:hypothetical protein
VQGLHTSRLVSGWILPAIRGSRPSKPTNAQELCIGHGRVGFEKPCSSPRHSSCTKSCISREDWTAYSKCNNAPESSINPNALMLKGRALATLSPRVARIGPRVAKFDAEVAKMSRGVAKSAPFRVDLATWLATLDAAVKSSERVWWYLNNFLSLNCPESARWNAPPLAATMQRSDNGSRSPFRITPLQRMGYSGRNSEKRKISLPTVMHILDAAGAGHRYTARGSD